MFLNQFHAFVMIPSFFTSSTTSTGPVTSINRDTGEEVVFKTYLPGCDGVCMFVVANTVPCVSVNCCPRYVAVTSPLDCGMRERERDCRVY